MNIPAPTYKRPPRPFNNNKSNPTPIKFDENGINACPICNKFVETDDNYCRYCGQRIYLNLKEE